MSRRGLSRGRRQVLKAIPAAVVSGLAGGAITHAQQDGTTPGIARAQVEAAERLIGLDFTEAEEDLMLANLATDLERYRAVRAVDIPHDVEPPMVFRPLLPGSPRPSLMGPRVVPRPLPRVVTVKERIEDLAFESVGELAQRVEARQVTSTDLTRMYLNRLERHGETLKCVITLTPDLALDQAARADRELQDGRSRGPLHGIPWGAKDLFATRGIRTTWGTRPYEQQVLDLDATVVERLREAGAVLVAKLSMGALASGDVWFGGSTRNPWNLARGSGGSSAGPGAATAAGLVGFSIGTETLGSIIGPSSLCGVAGLRPTYGRVSRHGAMALSWSMDKIGPICRSVEDCALVLAAVAGPDGRDESVVDAAFDWQPSTPITGLRIGYVEDEFERVRDDMTADQRERWARQREVWRPVVDAFATLGATLRPIEMPALPALALRTILNAEAAAAFDDLTRQGDLDRLPSQGPTNWPNVFRTARFVPAVEYLRAQRARTVLMRRMAEVMSSVDLVLSPTVGTSLTIANLTGQPGLALKAGFIDGMPVGVMLTGRVYDEATLLRAGLAYERAHRWRDMHPPLA